MSLERNPDQPAPHVLGALVHANFPRTRLLDLGPDRSDRSQGASLAIGLDASDRDEKWLGDQLFAILVRNADELEAEEIAWNHQTWSKAEGGPRAVEGDRHRPNRIQVDFTPSGRLKTEFPRTLIDIAVLRSGLEDLARSFDKIA